MNLKIDHEDTIELPNWIGGTSLSLAEIGAIACFACVQNKCAIPEVYERLNSEDFGEAVLSLKEQGIIHVELKEGNVSISLNLDAVIPASFSETEEMKPKK